MHRHRTGRSRLAGIALLAGVALGACSSEEPPEPPDTPTPTSSPTASASSSASSSGDRRADAVTRVVAVGDIACAPGEETTPVTCRHAETAELTASLDPDAVLLLGDLQYESGALDDFRGSFDRTWGALGDRLRPVPGNHEYRTPGASGYADYVAERDLADPRGYERFRLGSWTAYALDSNCDVVDCAPQDAWLRQQLARDSGCSLMYLHHPRYSTGEHGPSPLAERFFGLAYRSGVEMVLSAHDHHYERFSPMDNRERERSGGGTVQYVSGAGGKSHYAATGDGPGSQVSIDDEFGVLELELGRDGWSSVFHGVDGDEQDPFTSSCH